ncbi:heavy metal-associated domain protein [Lachnoanaerobaculum saburreum F0468]|jgi:Heavy-metal-associated domain.|uniref:Heavy metal-associated domain protein n=2 Tax=Lachnoanaerobaculum saburreum TaxID=467210 RepID=I0R7Q2_9FIRM|nr:heavy-metal-associated domain-containing protein [Lachnoanaerobaculum saburreum]EFU77619.1 heavy metal-associated domain protein [Lachnoanaerobaculum saburreum DSM 3986]EIC95710.1 heavy metal-associated domain protein [Lachnoanaerobaculum saburreum F0468]RKW50539.1 MAG: cation transporter [Lachnospiraceae bacterium]
MKRVYKLEGLDCADCAAKLERKLAAIEGITSANINFMTLKCTLEAEADKMNEIIDKAMEIISVEEPDVEVRRA